MYPSLKLLEKRESYVLNQLHRYENRIIQCGDCESQFKIKDIETIYIADGPDDVARESQCPICGSNNIDHSPTKETK